MASVPDEEVKEGTILFRRDIKEALDVALGDYQAVPRCHRAAVAYDVGHSVAGDLRLLVQGKFAEGTPILGHDSLQSPLLSPMVRLDPGNCIDSVTQLLQSVPPQCFATLLHYIMSP